MSIPTSTAPTYDARSYRRGISALAFTTTGHRPPELPTHVVWAVVALYAVLAVCAVLVAWGPGGIRIIAAIVGLVDVLEIYLRVTAEPVLVVRPRNECGAR